MNIQAPLDDRWRTPLILAIGYAIASAGLGPAILIAVAEVSRGAFVVQVSVAGAMIAMGAALVSWLWLNAGKQRRHDPTTWRPIVAGIGVTGLVGLVTVGHLVLVTQFGWGFTTP